MDCDNCKLVKELRKEIKELQEFIKKQQEYILKELSKGEQK
jgi:hypothetical protein